MDTRGITDILETLPHRYPFLLIDRITKLKPGEEAVGLKNVTFNEPFFQGHFPGEPIMPGVLIVEALAQVGAVAVLSMPENRDKLALFTKIEKFRFKRIVRPGDQLVLTAALTALRGSLGRGEVEAVVDGEVVASGVLWFSLVNEESAGSDPA